MEDMKVIIVNTDTNEESLCGMLKMRSEESVHGQTYKIPCDMKCGDEVKLTVYHGTGDYENAASIHMAEITAYIMPGQLKIDLTKNIYTTLLRLPSDPIYKAPDRITSPSL